MSLALIALLPFMGAVLPALLIRSGRTVCAVSAGAVTLSALTLLMVNAPSVFRGEALHDRFEWMPGFGLNATFMLDGLGLLFAGLILGIGLLIIIYARFYLAKADPMGRFFSYLLLFQGAMVGIVLSDNVLMLLIFWELTSLSSFLLIGYWRHLPEGRQGARMALAVTGMGGLAMIGGMLILGQIAGSYDLSVILQHREAIQASPLYLPALILILIGCFTKSAQFPFHFWLPHAMAAPTPVSAYLHSATMVKAGLFLMARLWPVLAGTPEWFYIVATTGLVTMLIAAVIALFKDDLKALLAYSTVSHLGLVTMLLGFGAPIAAVAAVFHIINHATFKAALFMTAGIVDHEAHTRDVGRLGGLAHLMPITATIATVAGLSMAGVAPLNGFLSKEMMLEAALHTSWGGAGWLVPAMVALATLFSVAYSLRYVFFVFFGQRRYDYPHTPHDPPLGMWFSPGLLAALVVLIGLMPATIAGPLVAVSAGAVIGGPLPYYSLALWHGFTPALVVSLAALALGALTLRRYAALRDRWDATPRPEAKALFDATLAALFAVSRTVTTTLQNGSLRRYLAVLFTVVLAVGLIAHGGAGPDYAPRPMLPVAAGPLALWILLLGASAAVAVMHHNRLFALILTSVAGLVVSVAFAYLSAPDLALTQISVEVVTLILMLLALNLLPKQTPRESSGARIGRDGVLAAVGGLCAGGLTWAILRREGTSISDYYLANSYSGGGGTNVVNVILVDFRGYDTFGEIIVLGIAALAIFALLDGAMHGVSRRRLARWTPDQARSADRHPLMLAVAARLMFPFALTVGLYILLRGHNEPGGGFIAALVVSIALLMQYIASGYAWSAARMRIDYHAMIGWGVVIAGLTGVAAWLAGRPFLTSAFGYVTLPPLDKFELASAMAFDLGVFLTVVGAVMLALANLSRIARLTEAAPDDGPMDVDPSDVRHMPQGV